MGDDHTEVILLGMLRIMTCNETCEKSVFQQTGKKEKKKNLQCCERLVPV